MHLSFSSRLVCKLNQNLFNLPGPTIRVCASPSVGDQRSWRWWTTRIRTSRGHEGLSQDWGGAWPGFQGCGGWQGRGGGRFKIIKTQRIVIDCQIWWQFRLFLLLKISTLRSIAKFLRMIILAYFNQQVENLLLVFRSCTRSDWWQSLFEALLAKTLLISRLPGYLCICLHFPNQAVNNNWKQKSHVKAGHRCQTVNHH